MFEESVVLFAVPERRLREMKVATGPCVPVHERERAICSPLAQDGGERPRNTAALYRVLTGQDESEALRLIERAAQGALYICSDPFVAAMAAAAEASLALADEDDAAGDRELSRFGKYQDEIDHAWLHSTDWPDTFVSTTNRLTRLGLARQALRSETPLWAWYGPSVPQFVVSARQGPQVRDVRRRWPWNK